MWDDTCIIYNALPACISILKLHLSDSNADNMTGVVCQVHSYVYLSFYNHNVNCFCNLNRINKYYINLKSNFLLYVKLVYRITYKFKNTGS